MSPEMVRTVPPPAHAVSSTTWFTKNLPTAITDDIELRICVEYSPLPEDVPVELIELYVK